MKDIQKIMDFIYPEQVGRYWFRGKSPIPQGRIFGGQVLAQCLLAANQTVDESLTAHSMHAYFLRAGDPNVPIEFEVDPIRNGRSFSTRRVVARQHDQAIFNTSVSFQKHEEGFSHSEPIPEVSPPDLSEKGLERSTRAVSKPNLIDLYKVRRWKIPQVESEIRANQPAHQHWFAMQGRLEDDPRIHQAALAMISDFTLMMSSVLPHWKDSLSKDFMGASLDHAIWFHAPVDMNELILYRCEGPWAGNARGFNRGTLWGADGTLVASTTQEGLMRIKTQTTPK